MSTLRVGNITATGGTGTITVPTGNQISQVDRPSGLVLVKTQTIGTAVSSVTVTDAFSADFDNYKIIVNGGASSANTDLGVRLGSTTTNYRYGIQAILMTNSTSSVLGASSTTSFPYVGGSTANGLAMNFDLLSPNLAKNTHIQGVWYGGIEYSGYVAGVLMDTTQYTAFTIFPAAGTITGGTIRVYGYRNS